MCDGDVGCENEVGDGDRYRGGGDVELCGGGGEAAPPSGDGIRPAVGLPPGENPPAVARPGDTPRDVNGGGDVGPPRP